MNPVLAFLGAVLMGDADMTPAWFALILQGGSFGVLVYLIIYGVPLMRKEIAKERSEELDTYKKDLRDARKDFMMALENTSAVFKTESAAERMACERHFESLASAMSKGNEATIMAVRTMAEQIQSHAERNRQWSAALQAEIASKKEG